MTSPHTTRAVPLTDPANPERIAQYQARYIAILVGYGYDHTEQRAAFLKLMEGKEYGEGPLLSAWAWFREGQKSVAVAATELDQERDIRADRETTITLIAESLGVTPEPHQTFFERLTEAAGAVRAQPYQERVHPFMLECFGAKTAWDTTERQHRFLEEALELVQATGCSASEAHQLVDYVFGRPIGEPHQEVGGVMVTLAALCTAAGLKMDRAGDDELARCWSKIDKIRLKHAAKPKFSPLPGNAVPQGSG